MKLLRAGTVFNSVITACVALAATSLMTNFFAPSETGRVLHQFWTLPVSSRFVFVVGLLALPFLAIQFGRLLWHTVKGLLGWDLPADRSPWFVTSRVGALVLLVGADFFLGKTLMDIGGYLVT